MNFPDALFPASWALGAFLPLGLVWLWCLHAAPWRRLRDAAQWNVWLGVVVTLSLLWSLKAGVRPGLNLHLLGATLFALMFGRELAIVGLSVVLAAVTLNAGLHGEAGWQAYALNALVLAVAPVLFADALRRLVEKLLPANFFIYIFVTAFFGAGLAMVATGLVAAMLLAAAGLYPPALLLDEYLSCFLLLGFAEGWLNGGAVTLMVVYFPQWVGSFDDRRYLLNK